jgi:hypothetical protein
MLDKTIVWNSPERELRPYGFARPNVGEISASFAKVEFTRCLKAVFDEPQGP